MTLTILGLGPGSADDLSRRAWRTLEQARLVYLRTERHPCVPDLPTGPQYRSFDALYEQHDEFPAVYAAIVAALLNEAAQGDLVYAVPGDPLVGETTTRLLLAKAPELGVQIEIVHGISFIEPMLRQAGVDALDGLQIFDAMALGAMHHPPINPEYPALIAQVYSRQTASDLKLTLMNQYPDDFEVLLVHGAGTSDQHSEHLPLYAIDRSDATAHLTSLYLPPLGPYTSFEAFQEIVAHLRAPEGCPWDRKQTHLSLRSYLIEEAYEVLEALNEEDTQALAGELGDLLLQIVLHTQIAIEEGEFTMADVMRLINEKMIRRHPHVWGSVDVQGSADQVLTNWEAIKRAEHAENGRERKSRLDGVPMAAPSLVVALKIQDKAAKVGFDWPDVGGVIAKAEEEMREILNARDDASRAQEIGDLIFVLVNWLRWLGVDDPESIVHRINRKFVQRFRYVEENADRPLEEMTLAEMDALWDAAKAQGL